MQSPLVGGGSLVSAIPHIERPRGVGYFKGMGMCSRSVVKGWGWVLEIPDLVYELEGDGHMKLLRDRSQLDLDELKVRVQYALGAD